MKVCMKCNRTYTDESLAFCLECGVPLRTAGPVSGQAVPTAVMTPTQYAQHTPTAQMQPNVTTPEYTPPPPPQTPSHQFPNYQRPSNAGRLTAILCILLTIGGLLLFTIAMFGSATKLMDETAIGVLVLLAMFIPAFGTLVGLFALYRAFRSRDGKGAKKTAVLGIVINLLYIVAIIGLMTLGALSLFLKL